MNVVTMSAAALQLAGASGQLSENPLSASHRRELAATRELARPIRKAARVAAFNGWSTAAIAALSLPFSLSSAVGLALTAALACVAFIEFRGRRRLLDFEPGGAFILGWNQLGLLAIIAGYSAWMMQTSIVEAGSLSTELQGLAQLDSGLAGMVESYQPMIRQAVRGFYLGVIALSVVFQGGTALYYFSRRRIVEDFIAATPEWARDVQRGLLPA